MVIAAEASPQEIYFDEMDAFVDAGFSYDDARRAFAAGVTDPHDPDLGKQDEDYTAWEAELSEPAPALRNNRVNLLGIEVAEGDSVPIKTYTQQLHRALGALAQLSQLGGLSYAAGHEPHASMLERRYNGRLPRLTDNAAAKRERLGEMVRPTFVHGATGETNESALADPDVANAWRGFYNRFSGSAGAKARAAYRKQLAGAAAVHGFELLEVE